MAFAVKDRVKETTTTTGTGTVTLLGASSGYQAFSAVGDGNTCHYCIAGQGTTEWEVGLGTYTLSGAALARTTVLASSNAGSAVNFSAGTKDVFNDVPAAVLGLASASQTGLLSSTDWTTFNGKGTVTSIATTGPITGGTITGSGTIALNVGVDHAFTAAQSVTKTINATSADGLLLTNTTAATVGAQQWSPRLHFTGQGWKTTSTAGSQTVDWIAELQPIQGAATPTSSLIFSSQINGAGYNAALTLGAGPSIAGAKLTWAIPSNAIQGAWLVLDSTASGGITSKLDLLGSGGSTQIFGGQAASIINTPTTSGTWSFQIGGTARAYLTNTTQVFGSGVSVGFSSNADPSAAVADAIFTRGGAAIWQQGAANAASPVAQTLQAQGSRAGTDTNVSGANYTHSSGQGTGNAAGSSLIFQTPVAVASGSGAQTMTTALTINGTTATFTNAATFSALTAGRIPFSGTAGLQADSASFLWDNSNIRLGVGTSAPSYEVHAIKTVAGGPVALAATNGSTASGSTYATVLALNSVNSLGMYQTSTGYTTAGLFVADAGILLGSSATLIIDSNNASGKIIFAAGGSGAANEIVRFDPTTGVTIKSGVKLQLGNAAATGLTAGVLAATTNATLVLYDSGGQAYRVPCII